MPILIITIGKMARAKRMQIESKILAWAYERIIADSHWLIPLVLMVLWRLVHLLVLQVILLVLQVILLVLNLVLVVDLTCLHKTLVEVYCLQQSYLEYPEPYMPYCIRHFRRTILFVRYRLNTFLGHH